MNTKAVIFDLDGTLTAFNLDYMTLRSEVRGVLMKNGVPASVLFINESIFDMLNKTEIFFKNTGKSAKTLDKVRDEALSIAERHELEAAKITDLLPSVMETLKTLRQMKLRLAYVPLTAKKQRITF